MKRQHSTGLTVHLVPATCWAATLFLTACHSFKWEPSGESAGSDTASSEDLTPGGDSGRESSREEEEDPRANDDTGEAPESDPPPSSSCDELYPGPSGNTFYVDPVVGSVDNDGSQSAPWASIQYVIDHRVDCVDQAGEPHHASAPVQGGDSIILVGATGHDPEVSILGCFNTDYVSIIGEEPRVPVLEEIEIKGGAYWHFEGMTLEGGGGSLIRMDQHSTRGDVHHVRVHNNFMTSGDLPSIEDFSSRAAHGIRLSNVTDVSISCNDMINVAMGVVVSGDRVDVLFNTIRFFAEDGLVNGGSQNRYIGNVITDGVKLGDGHHDDFFQSHRGVYPDTSTDVEVSYNIFMNRYTDEQPSGSHGPVQCIGAFEDGPKTNWRVVNNVCKGDHYHGITLKDTNDSVVINNTVVGGGDFPGVDWDTPDRTWISVSGTGNAIRNNLSSNLLSDGDHNFTVTPETVHDVFRDWDAGDFGLQATAPVIDGGSLADAPPDDILGVPRAGLPDIGAYESGMD